MAASPGFEPGGIGSLVAFLREHGDAVEADLQRFYGIALSDLTCGRLSWRRLSVLLGGLPQDSATARAVGGDAALWGLSEHLLAGVFDALQVANWQRGAKKGSKPPKPTPRPGVQSGDKVGRTTKSPEEVKALLARYRPEASDGD